MLLIRNANLYTPDPAGRNDILIAGRQIARIAPSLSLPDGWGETWDAHGLLALPGFIDSHVHMMGGGGEGGFATRTPELVLSDAIRGGVTTVVGCLGTDGVTRSIAGLLAKARGLQEEGLSTFVYTGHYALPVQPLTGSIERDLIVVDKVIGVGEVAISDHRSSQPTFDEFVRTAAEARRGGILSGKAGVVNIHLGDGPRGLALLRRAVDETELPRTQFVPTHINRNPSLFDEGIAWAKQGGFVDFTTSTVPAFLAEGEVKSSTGLRRMLDAGVPIDQVSFTSDGQGSLPDFDAAGRLRRLEVGRVTSLFAEVRDAVRDEGVPLETALRVITANPARMLKLRGKGVLQTDADADVILVDPVTFEIHGVVAGGRWLMKDGTAVVRGTFEA